MLYGNIIFIKKIGGDGSKYPVTEKSISIGRRENCLIRIYNSNVAPEHCQLLIDDNGQAKLRNFSNHTILNGKPMSKGEATLCHGDIFKLGDRLARWEYLPSSKHYKQVLSPSGRLVAVVMPQQRSTEEQINSKTPARGKSRKSTLLSCKMKLESPQTVQSLIEHKSPDNKPYLLNKSTEKLVNSVRKSAVKTLNLKSIAESPAKQTVESFRSSTSLRSSPSKANTSVSLFTPEKKISSKSVRLIKSEKRLNSTTGKSLGSSKAVKRLSLALKPTIKTPTKSALQKMYDNFSKTVIQSVENPNLGKKVFDSYVFLEKSKLNVDRLGSVKKKKTPPKTPASKRKASPSKSPVNSAKTPRKITTPSVDPKRSQSKKTPPSSVDKKNSSNVKSQKSTPARSRSAVKKTPQARKSASKEKITSAKGVRRKLSPSISSAERAAKKLKTSSPKKPDKNKKAALLMLGKANRKQLLSQTVKVMLKQKIVKKAIKQSTSAPVRRDDRALGRKGPKKSAAKPKKIIKKPRKINSKTVEASNTVNTSSVATKLTSSEEQTPKLKKEENLNRSKLQTGSPSKSQVDEVSLKSPAKQMKKSETSFSPIKQSPIKLNLSSVSSIRSSGSYVFGSNRRCSKRLSSKNELSRPDFMELSPTALGLMPKNVEVFKTPKEIKRRSSSLATPKNAASLAGIMKSASTSKLGNRKSLRFSSKDLLFNSTSWTPNTTQGTDFDFESIQTPNITTDMFVSPLVEKTPVSILKKDSSKSTGTLTPAAVESEKSKGTGNKSPKSTAKCVRKLLQSPPSQKTPKKTPSSVKKLEVSINVSPGKANESNVNKSPKKTPSSVKKREESLKASAEKVKESNVNKNPIKSPSSVKKRKESLKASAEKVKGFVVNKSPKKSPSSAKKLEVSLKASPKKVEFNVKKTPKKSPSSAKKREVSLKVSPKKVEFNVKKTPKKTPPSVKKREESSKASAEKVKGSSGKKTPKNVSDSIRVGKFDSSKSPKNNLSETREVFQLIEDEKSPRNDLRGVKKLSRTLKVQKSPKNDLTDLRGVKRLLQSPKNQKSPKNDLTDVRGVKKLLKSPRVQKSPKNDLTDVRGVKKLLKSPRVQKSPKNDLTDVRGVKKLLKTPRVQKSPKNDLTDVKGVKKLLKTPRVQKSPKNDLSDVIGVKELMKTPRTPKSPLNDLSDLRGVRRLLGSPKLRKSPKNDLTDVSGVGELFVSPKTSESVEQATKTSQSQRASRISVADLTGVKQFLIAKSPAADQKYVFEKAGWSDLRTIRGRRTIYSSPKNDLSDLQGVRDLFSRHKTASNLDISFTGVAELFDFPTPKVETVKRETSRSWRKKSVSEVKSSETSEDVHKNEETEEIVRRRGRPRRGTKQEGRTSTRSKNESSEASATGRKLLKRKAVEKVGREEPKKPARMTAKSQTAKTTRGGKSQGKAAVDSSQGDATDVRESRKRKVTVAESLPSPPKLRKRQAASQEPAASRSAKKETTKRAVSKGRQKVEPAPEEKTPTTRKKVSASTKNTKATKTKTQSKTTKTATKISSKPIPKVQKGRSQATSSKTKRSESKENVSPRKTRSVKAKPSSQEKKPKVQNKTVRMKVEKKKVSPVVKTSSRRK